MILFEKYFDIKNLYIKRGDVSSCTSWNINDIEIMVYNRNIETTFTYRSLPAKFSLHVPSRSNLVAFVNGITFVAFHKLEGTFLLGGQTLRNSPRKQKTYFPYRVSGYGRKGNTIVSRWHTWKRRDTNVANIQVMIHRIARSCKWKVNEDEVN